MAADRDYVAIAIAYADRAVKDRAGKNFGLYIRQAARRFKADLRRAKAKKCAFYFDDWHARDVCDFLEKMPHVEGTWKTSTIVLHESHVFFLVQLFGFRMRKAQNYPGFGEFHPRRFTSALFAVARKNAKSTLSAGIMNYCLCCEPEPGAQLISAATTYDQASIIFNLAKRQIEKLPDLRDAFGLQVWAKAVTRIETGSNFKALHAKASTQDGLNPSHVALDEIHAHKTPDLLNVLTSAAGARANPLWLYTTTEGYLSPGPWADLRSFAIKLLSGVFKNTADHFLVVFYAVDEENKAARVKQDDDFNESAWRKANPLIDVNPNLLEAIRKEAVEAREMPSKMAEFRIKRLNRQASVAAGFVNLVKWKKCGGPVDLEALRDVPCYGGLDLASTRDIAAFRLVWELDGVYFTHGWRWVPAAQVATRTERGTVPYAAWVESGHLKQTDGDTIDYRVIREDIRDICEQFNVQRTGYDRWNATDLITNLVDDGLELVEFIQGPRSYHPAMQDLEIRYLSGKLAHGNDPVLEWCAANLVPRFDQNLNMAPDKARSADKIDDMSALLMAIGVTMASRSERTPEYEILIV
jgi:phage terminase large subunit-like protein